MNKVLVIGAGAMGSLFAARMVDAGLEVTLVDTDVARLLTIKQLGLELVDDAGTRTVRPVTSAAADFTSSVDLVLLFTKGMHSKAAAESVAHLARYSPLALTLQNGIGNAEVLAEVFGAERVLMGTAMIPADIEPPNRVVTHGFSSIHLGGYVPAAEQHAEEVLLLLRRSGFEPEIAPNVELAVWEKLAFNAALNATAMITLSNNGQLNNPSGLRIAQAVLDETIAIARAKDLHLDPEKLNSDIQAALERHPGHEASMLQDRKNGRLTEIETINGALVREGQRLKVPTPVNATLTDLVRLIEGNLRSAR